MSPEDTIVCLCTRQNFEISHKQKILDICQSQSIRWNAVYETADRHQLTPLVHVNLSQISNDTLGMSQTVLNRFKTAYIHNVFVKKEMDDVLEKILAFFSQKGVDVMLVKGDALDRFVYPQPWYTISHDVDLVIKARKEELDDALRGEIVAAIEEFNHKRHQFKEHIEYDYYEHHDITMNNLLAVDFERIWNEAHRVQVNSYDVFVMSPEDMLLAAAINSCRKRFFRLKSLCDIAAIIEKYPGLDWHTLVSKSQAYKCNTIVYTALVVTQAIVGCRLPGHILSALEVNPFRAALIDDLVTRLYRRFSLDKLYVPANTETHHRKFSWSLLLTYATYRTDFLGPKLAELYRAWRNLPLSASQ